MALLGSDSWPHIWSNTDILIFASMTFVCPGGPAVSLSLIVPLNLQFEIEGTERRKSYIQLLRNAQNRVLRHGLLVVSVPGQRLLYCCSLWLLRPVFTPTPDSIRNTSLSTRLAHDRFRYHKHGATVALTKSNAPLTR